MNKRTITMYNILTYVVICICLANIVECGQQESDIKYINCSPSNLCYSCYNEYFCNQCAPDVKCCPKYCKTCSNNTYCNTCEKGFMGVGLDVQKGQNAQRICYNVDPSIDSNRDKSNIHKCKEGYYLDDMLEFCQKCLIPNCKTCHQDAMNCIECQQGYYRFGDLCFPYKTNQTNQTDQDAMYILMMMIGIIIGFFIACFIIQICSCTKKGCLKIYNWYRNRNNNKEIRRQRQKLIDMEMNVGANNIEAPIISLSDQQKQFAFKVQIQQDKEYVQIIPSNKSQVRNKRQPIITQARNNY